MTNIIKRQQLEDLLGLNLSDIPVDGGMYLRHMNSDFVPEGALPTAVVVETFVKDAQGKRVYNEFGSARDRHIFYIEK